MTSPTTQVKSSFFTMSKSSSSERHSFLSTLSIPLSFPVCPLFIEPWKSPVAYESRSGLRQQWSYLTFVPEFVGQVKQAHVGRAKPSVSGHHVIRVRRPR